MDSKPILIEGASPSELIPDIKLARRAFRERWPITDEQRHQIITSLLSICINDEIEDVRARVNAGKALIDADKLNVEVARDERTGDTQKVVVSGIVEHQHKLPLTQIEVRKLTNEELEARLKELE